MKKGYQYGFSGFVIAAFLIIFGGSLRNQEEKVAMANVDGGNIKIEQSPFPVWWPQMPGVEALDSNDKLKLEGNRILTDRNKLFDLAQSQLGKLYVEPLLDGSQCGQWAKESLCFKIALFPKDGSVVRVAFYEVRMPPLPFMTKGTYIYPSRTGKEFFLQYAEDSVRKQSALFRYRNGEWFVYAGIVAFGIAILCIVFQFLFPSKEEPASNPA